MFRQLEKICALVDSIDLKTLRNYNSIEEKWCYVRDRFLAIVDEIAPLREISINLSNQFPWYDEDLIIVKHSRDSVYKKFKRSLLNSDMEIFEYFKRQFKQLNDEKLIEFFKDKTMNDFKNAKKFWKFYSPLVKIKSDKSSNDSAINKKFDNRTIDDKDELCNVFNKFFTSITSATNLPVEK